MQPLLNLVFVVLCFQLADFSDSVGGGGGECVIELECEECLPEYMPLVTSPGGGAVTSVGGVVRVPHGEELALSCGRGHFLAFPRAGASLLARCEAGRYRVPGAPRPLPLLHLGCQQNVLEDVPHSVEHCAPPLQGRAYETQEGGGAGGGVGTRHLATLCYDAERAVPVRLRTRAGRGPLPLAAHSDARAPLSIFGNFNYMFDSSTRHAAERLYSDEPRLDRRLRELFKHERYSFAAQHLATGKLLAAAYFETQEARVAEFTTNKVVSWRSVVQGNLRHLHQDVAGLLARSGGALEVYAGSHGVLALHAAEPEPEVYLGEGRRFPVPRYLWTVVHAPQRNQAVALVLLNDPFVTVSEIREAVFCSSACARVPWLTALTRHRNYERPLLGLVFCCHLPEFTAVVGEMPPIFNATLALLTLT